MAKNGLSFNFDFEASDSIKTIENILRNLKDAEVGFKSIAHYMQSRVIEHFRQNQGSTKQWEKLSDVTIALRLRGKKSNPEQILRDSGNLFLSIQRAATGGPNSIFEYTKTYAKIGTTVSYAVYHEQPDNKGGTGSYSGKGKLPKRDFMFLSTKEIDDLKEIFEITFFGKGWQQ